MRSVRSAIASMPPCYCAKTSPAPPSGVDKRDTRGFSDDPLDGFRDLATDLCRFGSVFLAGTTAEFAALVTKAERSRPPRGFAALSPGHHPARLGLPHRRTRRARNATP
jgi:hypothetical protein